MFFCRMVVATFLAVACLWATAQVIKMDDEEARKILAAPLPAKATAGPDALEAWKRRESAALQLGQLGARVEALRQLADAAPDSESRFKEREKVVTAFDRTGRFENALAERDEIVEDRRIGPGRRAIFAANLAQVMALRNDTARSQRYIARANSLAEDAKADEIELLPSEPAVLVLRTEGTIAYRRGETLKAWQGIQKAVDLSAFMARDLNLSEKRRRAALNTLGDLIWTHTLILEALGRRDEAFAIAREALQRAAVTTNPKPGQVALANLEYTMARVLGTAGDYENALVHINASLEKFKSSGVHEHSNNYALARRQRALIYAGLGRYEDMKSELDLLIAAKSTNQTLVTNTTPLLEDGLLALAQGRQDEAILKAEEYSAEALRWRGRDSTWYKSAKALELLIRLADPRSPIQLGFVETAVNGLGMSDSQPVDGTQRATDLEAASLEKVLHRIIEDPSGKQLAFKVAEVLRTDASQGALLAGAAKMAAATPELRELIEKERSAISSGYDKRLLSARAAANADNLKKSTADELVMKRQMAEIEAKAKALADEDGKVGEIRKEIARKFPRYQELISPKIPTAADIAKALKPDEIYVNLFPGREAGYAFAVLPSGELLAWKVPITRAETSEAVRQYRKLFDSAQPPVDASALGGLDLQAGAKIHKAWLAPIIEKVGAGKTIYLAASGPLAAVPWAALPDSAGGSGASGDNRVRWAVESGNFVTMPSASSLVLTRSLPASRASKPLLAFADPSYDGAGASAVPPGPAARRSVAAARDANPAADFDYRKLNRLPETLDEVKAIAAAVGGDAASIVSGVSATRSRVLKEDLSQVKLLAFATHGLSPGEIPGQFQAGLAMAYEGAGLKDSVLSVEDVSNLRLNADIVLLSACNTGFATGGVGDSVSALARGFFIAGARSLLVTGWAVESESAKELMVGTFKAMQGSSVSKARALADTQRAMLGGKYGERYRHPFFWAPYFLVGDAAR